MRIRTLDPVFLYRNADTDLDPGSRTVHLENILGIFSFSRIVDPDPHPH
jgi:hypothetical protein